MTESNEKNVEETLRSFTEELTKKNEALRSSEERYHKMVDEVQDYAIIFLDENGVIQNWNKGAQKIKQYEEQEVIGQHFSMFYLSEDRLGKLPEILLAQAREYGRAIHEGWRVRKDRTKFWGSITLTALHNDNGELIGFSKVTRDLTEKKFAEDQLRNFANELQISNEALRKSEERYHKMIAEVQDYAIVLLDVNGTIQNWNIGAQKIKGYSAEEIIGKSFTTFYPEEDQKNNLPMVLLNRAAQQGRAEHEGWRVTKQGKKFWGSVVITALHADDGSIIGFSKVTRDLTAKKEADDKLKEYVVELKKQNEELDRFAYTASHDLQEPLRKIQLLTDLLKQNPGDEALARKYLEKISASSQRLSELISSVLEYSKIANSNTEKVDTDLNEILAEVLSDFELSIKESNVKIKAERLPVIQGIPTQVNQLFANLIGNSLKYAGPDPSIEICCGIAEGRNISHCKGENPEGNFYELVFTDNGIGFEPEYAQIIFSLFQRLHSKHQYHGTGVGLALCKKIMDNHCGYIFGKGEPGKGASFYVYFPVSHSFNQGSTSSND
jgi:PAS domain S-box-containing protein